MTSQNTSQWAAFSWPYKVKWSTVPQKAPSIPVNNAEGVFLFTKAAAWPVEWKAALSFPHSEQDLFASYPGDSKAELQGVLTIVVASPDNCRELGMTNHAIK